MPIWKIGEKGPTKLPETKLKEEKLLEEQLEDWIVADPSILGEPLLVLGRQVLIPDTKDRLDVLAIDPQGNAVVIEMKRGKLRDPVDVQALRYASYVSKWKFEDFENQARNFLGKVGDPDFNFNALYEGFCEDAGVDEIPTLNQDQRMIIVGSSVRDKLGTVALWLRDHSIDITVIEIQAYKEGDSVLLQPTTIVPFQVKRFADTGRIRPEGAPWLVDGKEWHLQKRCSLKTREVFEKLDKILQDNFEIDGPRWNQKYYVAYRVNNLQLACRDHNSQHPSARLSRESWFAQSGRVRQPARHCEVRPGGIPFGEAELAQFGGRQEPERVNRSRHPTGEGGFRS